MKKKIYYILLINLIFLGVSCQTPVEKIKYKGIDRTLCLLQHSTEEAPNNVEILFYGQSIIGGMKTNILIDSLRAQYPFANITFKHKPIGGFTIPKLIKTAEHDLYHENPDLIIFHAYGGIKEGLYDELVKNIRQNMASDVLLLDHHYVWNKPSTTLQSINEAHDRDSKAIQEIADRYDCGIVQVRDQWKQYLIDNNIEANELMGNRIDPNVHPNDQGNKLLRSFVFSKLIQEPEAIYEVQKDSIRDWHEFKSQNNLSTNFTGNWVQLITDPSKNNEVKLEVLIDGKKPSAHKSNYYISRPTSGFKSWMPSILKVSLGENLPQNEKWTLEIFDLERETNTFSFKLKGNITGADGEGNSANDFTSDSGRIKIKKEDFYIFENERIFKNETPENFKVHFSVEPIVKDVLVLNEKNNRYNVFRGLNSENHEIQINVLSGNPIIEALLINQAFLNNNE
ncbi:SGNH/GDSL hydrolase family protein [Winogradskyella forsetii]|uniref:SGNH/GDSL hydrolase family protein n=1 Tax=Winogradskyella forsetii TaxID=2686077 RepID=UPI0015BAB167|nr:SGNH/GDSL hydrolase family protein [Winogradskyella forsetii]